jgi:hypothetical protein
VANSNASNINDLYVQGTGTLVNTSGLLTASNQFTFVNVSQGNDDVITTTDDGCTDT